MSGPSDSCPDGQPPKNLGVQYKKPGTPEQLQNYLQQVKPPEYVQKGTTVFAQADSPLGGLDLGGPPGGGPGAGQQTTLKPRPKSKRKHLSEEIRMMSDPDIELDENSDIKSIDQSCKDLEMDN